MNNREIAFRLEQHARLLGIAGENAFRARAFSRAAATIRDLPEQLTSVAAASQLRTISGVGEGIATAIEQLIASGQFTAHLDLTSRVPESLLELTSVPGVGPKTALRLYSALGIKDQASLEAMLPSGRIASTPGLGKGVESTIREGIEAIQRRSGRVPLGVALPLARSLMSDFSISLPQTAIFLAGSARRWSETVGDLDFVAVTDDAKRVESVVNAIAGVSSVTRTSRQSFHITFGEVIAADIFLTPAETLGSTLVRATGNAEHLARLGELSDAPTEELVYAARGLPWIPPELRTGGPEFRRWSEIPALVTKGDIRGDLHSHSTWSDGSASILEMVNAAGTLGYKFLAITDHSHGLGVAGGLDEIRLAAQRQAIAAVQREIGESVQLFAGAEVEVHRDGSLDYDNDTLSALDIVVASLHSGLRQPRAQLSARLDRVLRNPQVDIIAHPSGRLVERREGGDFDWNEVFATAAGTGTALEINADPARLDLKAEHAERASAAGCLISINCDAHNPAGFASLEYGIAVARRAWLKPGDIINCWPRDAVVAWLKDRGNRN